MAINPFVLPQGVAGLQYGLNPQRQQAPRQQPQQRPQMDPSVRNAGLIEALSSPVSVESGGIPEAIAEALAVGLRGRAARRVRQTELDTETREQKVEDGRRLSIADALTAYQSAGDDPNAQSQAMIAALAGGAPDQALELAMGRNGQRMEMADGLQLERDRTPILADRQRQVGDIEVEQGVREARETAPYRASSSSSVPSGYEPDPTTGGLRPIQGGPADMRQTAEGQARADRLASSERQLETGISALNQVLGFEAGNLNADATPAANTGAISGGTSGIWANRTREWGLNQGAVDLDRALEPVRAILSFENLAEMRRNSATGGALGSIAVRELELLSSTVRSLATDQRPEQLRANVSEVRRQLIRTQQAVAAARAEYESGGQTEAPSTNDGTGAPQPRRLRYDPATGQLQ